MSQLLVASHILLWLLVITEGVVILALMRQVGTLLLRVGSRTAFDAGRGPSVGDTAPWLPTAAQDSTDDLVTLLAFVSPGCGTCEELVPGLNIIASSYADRTRVFAVGTEAFSELEQWAMQNDLRVPVVSSKEAFERFDIAGTPYAFGIDAGGRIQARGGVNHTEQLESLLQACLWQGPSSTGELVNLAVESSVFEGR